MPLRPILLAALISCVSLPLSAGELTETDEISPFANAQVIQGISLTGDAAAAAMAEIRAAQRVVFEEQEARRIAENQPICTGNFYTSYCHYPDGTVEVHSIDRSSVPSAAVVTEPYVQW